VLAALAQALFHGGEVVLGHGAAEHVLLEDHILLLVWGSKMIWTSPNWPLPPVCFL
jgi:hypothetical protein